MLLRKLQIGRAGWIKRNGRKKKDGEKGRESEGEKLGHKENEVIIMSMAWNLRPVKVSGEAEIQ